MREREKSYMAKEKKFKHLGFSAFSSVYALAG
jgi:hypothetical protein